MSAGPRNVTNPDNGLNGLSERQRLVNDAITLWRAAGVIERRARKQTFVVKLLVRVLRDGSQRLRRRAEGDGPWQR